MVWEFAKTSVFRSQSAVLHTLNTVTDTEENAGKIGEYQ